MRRCYCILLSLNRFRRHFSTEALITIIRAHVFSQILYCLPLWGGASQQQLYRIQKVINFAAPRSNGSKAPRSHHPCPKFIALVQNWAACRGTRLSKSVPRLTRWQRSCSYAVFVHAEVGGGYARDTPDLHRTTTSPQKYVSLPLKSSFLTELQPRGIHFPARHKTHNHYGLLKPHFGISAHFPHIWVPVFYLVW